MSAASGASSGQNGRRAVRALAKRTAAAACRGLSFFLRIPGRTRRRRLILYYKYPDFARKTEAMADLLCRRGFQPEVRSGTSFAKKMETLASNDLWVGFWVSVPGRFMPRHYVFFNAEPLHVPPWDTNDEWFEKISGAEAVWNYTRSGTQRLVDAGIGARFVPFGYAPHYEASFRAHVDGKSLPRDIDVLFVGSVFERRRRVLDALRTHGMRIHVVSRDNPAYGERLDELYARSKIVLGIHQYEEPEAQIPDLARLDHPLSNRLFVVHERPSASDADPAFAQNVVTCGYDEIPETCAHFLARPEERQRRAADGHAWFRSAYDLDKFIPYDLVRELMQRG